MITTTIRIAVAEPSPIIRSGLELQLRRLARYKVQVLHLIEDGRKDWLETAAMTSADIFVLNPLLASLSPQQYFLSQRETAKFVALSYGTTDEALLREYDDILRITDSVQQIANLFDRLIQVEVEAPGSHSPESQSLTPREREIVVCVVKGMTNKEIANALFLSTHTVITHRRNITKKLQIHSPSGLTIYAIMNKLVELDEINRKNNVSPS